MAKERIEVLIVDDLGRVREGLRAVLALEEDVQVVGEATDGVEAVRLAEALRPDVVLMDVKMPGLDGIEATRRIKKACPEVKVIVLTMYGVHHEQALGAGADAFLLKSSGPEQLMVAIRHVAGAGNDGTSHAPWHAST